MLEPVYVSVLLQTSVDTCEIDLILSSMHLFITKDDLEKWSSLSVFLVFMTIYVICKYH